MKCHTSWIAKAPLALWAAGWLGHAAACSMNVREAGFIDNIGGPCESRPYVLEYVFKGERAKTDALLDRLAEFVNKELAGLNLAVNPTDGNNLKSEQRETIEQAGADPDDLPLSLLRRMVYYDEEFVTVLPGALSDEALRSMAASPKKQELKRLLSVNTNYCVFVFIPGSDQQANAAAMRELQAASAEHGKAFPGQLVPIATLSPDDRAESFLLQELGVGPDAVNPQAAIIFGKFRFLTPTLVGDDVHRDLLTGALEFLHRNASDCTVDAVDVPGATRDLLGAWSFEESMRMVQAVAESGAVPDMPWWNEAEVDPQTGELVETAEAVAPPPAQTEAAAVATWVDADAPRPRPAWLLTLPILAGVLLVALVAGWLVLRAKIER